MNEETQPYTEAQRDGFVGHPTIGLLVNEHRTLMASLTYTRIVNRLLLVILVLFQVASVPQLVWKDAAVCIAGALAALSWFLHETLISQRAHRIGDFIAQTDTDEKGVDAFIMWRHELWQYSMVRYIQVLEPFLWLVLIIAIALVGLLYGRGGVA